MEYAYSVVHNAVSRRVLKHLVGEGVVSDDCFETIYFWYLYFEEKRDTNKYEPKVRYKIDVWKDEAFLQGIESIRRSLSEDFSSLQSVHYKLLERMDEEEDLNIEDSTPIYEYNHRDMIGLLKSPLFDEDVKFEGNRAYMLYGLYKNRKDGKWYRAGDEEIGYNKASGMLATDITSINKRIVKDTGLEKIVEKAKTKGTQQGRYRWYVP